jgi:transcriptional regulator with XRE-family HTH domain
VTENVMQLTKTAVMSCMFLGWRSNCPKQRIMIEVTLGEDIAATACLTRLNLASLRASRGLSLQDIACETKISTRYLRAIENEQFSALPGQIYSVSYIRQYAKAIGYDAETILLLLNELSPVSPQEESRVHEETLRLRGERYWRAVAGLLTDAAGHGW